MITFFFEGTSHGEGYRGEICGLPVGATFSVAYVNDQLRLRKCGYGRSARQSYDDICVFDGVEGDVVTVHGDIDFFVPNHTDNVQRRAEITALRPGHADLVGQARYKGLSARDISEIASARSSLCYVVLGAICKQILHTYGVFTYSYVTEIGGICAETQYVVGETERQDYFAKMHCADPNATEQMCIAADNARAQGDSLGGRVCVVCSGVPMGVGDIVPYAKRLDARIAANLVGIPSVKGVEFGLCESYAELSGKQSADKLYVTDEGNIAYKTNNCGGIVGGISNGNDIVCCLTVKAVPTVKGVQTVDSVTHQIVEQHYERADTCVVPQVGVIAENILAYVILEAMDEQGLI